MRGSGRQPRNDAGPVQPLERRRVTVAEARERCRGRRTELIEMDTVARKRWAGREAGYLATRITRDAGREGSHGPTSAARRAAGHPAIVEGTTVNTKHAWCQRSHPFIAAGAFHVSKPSDLIPELRPLTIGRAGASARPILRT